MYTLRARPRAGQLLARVFVYIALSNCNSGMEMGEDHVYCWDPTVLSRADEKYPKALEPPPDEEWKARPPSWAEFNVLRWGDEHRLVVVSVHAKSGGEEDTQKDVEMIGKAVIELMEARRHDGAPRSILIMGDFNLGPEKIAELLPKDFTLAFGTTDQCPATNIWRFNGSGSKEMDGHAYDSGFFWSTKPPSDYALAAAVPPVLLREHEQACKDMCAAAAAATGALQNFRKDNDGSLSSITQRALASMLDTGGAEEGTLKKWLRKEFCHYVKLAWSDHVPISVSITMPIADAQ